MLLLANFLILLSTFQTGIGVPTYCVESWQKKAARVKKFEAELRLDRENPEYSAIVRDESNNSKFRLEIGPGWADKKHTRIEGWWVELTDVGDRKGSNLLSFSNDDFKDTIDTEDYFTYIYPANEAEIENGWLPLESKRIVKIGDVYVEIFTQHSNVKGSAKKDGLSISVRISITNSSGFPRDCFKIPKQ